MADVSKRRAPPRQVVLMAAKGPKLSVPLRTFVESIVREPSTLANVRRESRNAVRLRGVRRRGG
jgi:hypothetical protein